MRFPHSRRRIQILLIAALSGQLISCQTIWDKHGFTPAEAQEWKKTGVQAKDAKPWKDFGFRPTEALVWRKIFDPRSARDWKVAGFTPAQAQAYRKNAIDLNEAKSWKASGFNQEDMLAWRKAGIKASEAKEWIELGFTHASFDLKNHGFNSHSEGLDLLHKSELLKGKPTQGRGDAIAIAKALQETLQTPPNIYREWLKNKYQLPEIVALQPWYRAGVKIEEIKTWVEVGIPPSVALDYLKENIPASTAKEWHQIGLLPENSKIIHEWLNAGLNATDYKQWSHLNIAPALVKEYIDKKVDPVVATKLMRSEKNFFINEYSESEHLLYDKEKVLQLSNGSFLGDSLFPFIFAYMQNNREIFAKTIPEIKEKINTAHSDYRASKVVELIATDQRIDARMNEFKEFLEIVYPHRICHTSEFQTQYADNKWHIVFTKDFPPATFSNVTQAFKLQAAWLLDNRLLRELEINTLSVANYPKKTCKALPPEERYLQCSIELSLKPEYFERFDDDKLNVLWCFSLPIQKINIPLFKKKRNVSMIWDTAG